MYYVSLEQSVITKINHSKSFKREIWLYNNGGKIRFGDKLDNVDRETILHFDDVDNMCTIFTDKIIDIARECIPTKYVTVRTRDKPWFNSELRKEIRIRDRLRRKSLKSKIDIAMLQYKKRETR